MTTSTARQFTRIILPLLFATLCIPVGYAHALTVSPARIEISSDPGEDVKGEFTIIGQEGATVTYYTSAENFNAEGETGTPQFSAGTSDIGSWIEVAPQVSVNPHEQQSIPFTIHIPKGAESGGHFGAIFLSTNPPQAGGGQVSVGSKIGVLILLTVSGPVNESAGIVGFGSASHFYTSLPVEYFYRFHNAGNDRIQPSGTLTVHNIVWHKSETITANAVDGNVLPKSTRRFTVLWGKGAPRGGFFGHASYQLSHFALGPYVARLDLNYGSDKHASATRVIFIFPWQLLSMVFVLLLILLFIIPRALRSYNRRVIRNAQRR